MTAPGSEPSDLPPGPEAEASAASPAQVEQEEDGEETDLPKDEPVESEKPDRVVTRKRQETRPEKKPKRAGPDERLGQIDRVRGDGATDLRTRPGGAGPAALCRASARRRSASRRNGRSASSPISIGISATRPARSGAACEGARRLYARPDGPRRLVVRRPGVRRRGLRCGGARHDGALRPVPAAAGHGRRRETVLHRSGGLRAKK